MFRNIGILLNLAGSSFESVAKLGLFVTDAAYFKVFDDELKNHINAHYMPALTRVVVKQLPGGAKVEAEVVALEESNKIVRTVTGGRTPKGLGPYVKAKRVSSSAGIIYLSGQVGVIPATGQLAEGLVEQTKQVMENLKNALSRAGSDFSHVLKTTVYLTDMDHYKTVNEEYAKAFTDGQFPTRSCIAVKALPRNALVEIDLVAVQKKLDLISNITEGDVPETKGLPFNLARKVSSHTHLIYISGVLGSQEGENGEVKIPDEVAKQTELAMNNLKSLVEYSCSSMDELVKVNIYLTDMSYYAEMNGVYGSYFQKGFEPTRTCVAVQELPKGAKVVIEAVTATEEKSYSSLD